VAFVVHQVHRVGVGVVYCACATLLSFLQLSLQATTSMINDSAPGGAVGRRSGRRILLWELRGLTLELLSVVSADLALQHA